MGENADQNNSEYRHFLRSSVQVLPFRDYLSNFFHIFPSVSPFNIFILCYNFKASLNFSTHTPSEFRKLSKCNHFFFKMLFRMFTFGQIGIFESFQLWLETLLSKYFNFLQKLRLFKKFESLKTQKAK